MPAERATIFESMQIGKETDPGTAVPATRRLAAMGVSAAPRITSSRFRPHGRKLDTLVVPGRRDTAGAIEGRATYNEIVYPLSSLLGPADITTPLGATNAREWLFEMDPLGPDNGTTYTVEIGSEINGGRFAHGLVTGFGMEFGTEEISVNGDFMGHKWENDFLLTSTPEVQTLTSTGSGGSLKLSVGIQQTGAIAWNASAVDISTALDALSNVAPGDIVVTGGPLNTTPVVLTFHQAFTYNQPLITIDQALLTGGTAEIEESTAGGALPQMALVPIDPNDVSIYIDETYAELGDTLMERIFMASFGIGDKYGPVWVINAENPSWVTAVELPSDATLGLTFAADTVGMAFLDTFEEGVTRYVRIEAIGQEIESGQDYQFTADFAAKAEEVDFDDQDGVVGSAWTLRLVADSDITGLRVLLRNELSSL